MDNSERMKRLAEAVKHVRDGNASQVPMGIQNAKAMIEKHLHPPPELEIANRLDEDGDAQAASVIRRQHAELTRLRDFAREVNEAAVEFRYVVRSQNEGVEFFDEHEDAPEGAIELIARPRRVEVGG